MEVMTRCMSAVCFALCVFDSQEFHVGKEQGWKGEPLNRGLLLLC